MWSSEWISITENLKRAILLEQSVERAAVRQSGCWTCGVTEKGDVLCGKAVAVTWVFPHGICVIVWK